MRPLAVIPSLSRTNSQYPVFSAMHGAGSWEPKLVAPSIEAFALCLRAFQTFSAGRSTPIALDANQPTPKQQAQFLKAIRSLTNNSQDALGFWVVQTELDLRCFRLARIGS